MIMWNRVREISPFGQKGPNTPKRWQDVGMRAAYVTAKGGPEVITVSDLPIPEPGPKEVRVKVKAAGVNFIDTYRRSGVYPEEFPSVPGREGAGIIEAAGSEIPEQVIGRRVAWAEAAGSYAEYVTVASKDLLHVPDGVPFEVAAALPLQGMTAHYLIYSAGQLREGSTCVITGGAGGVGSLAIQLAKRRGATVIATVGNPGKADLALGAGADYVIVLSDMADLRQELPDMVRKMTDGRGVDVFFDGIGKATFLAGLDCLRRRGTMVLFGGASGQVDPINPQDLNAGGSLFLTRPKLSDYVADRPELDWRWGELMELVRTASLDVRIGNTYDLADAAQAHRDIESGGTVGKLLITP